MAGNLHITPLDMENHLSRIAGICYPLAASVSTDKPWKFNMNTQK